MGLVFLPETAQNAGKVPQNAKWGYMCGINPEQYAKCGRKQSGDTAGAINRSADRITAGDTALYIPTDNAGTIDHDRARHPRQEQPAEIRPRPLDFPRPVWGR
jgi:hypothetical protein